MARTQSVEAVQALEQGSITFLYRPRVEEQAAEGLDDVQRLLVLLSPENSAYERLIAVGRKRFPHSARRDRFWGFVDLVLTSYDMNAALRAQVYGTRTRGLRHLPSARPFAAGAYALWTHEGHGHLTWDVQKDFDDPVAAGLEVEERADYILTVANPDPVAWGLLEPPDLQTELFDDLELHVPVPTPFSPVLQQRFRNRRFAQLDSTDWLDHPGAELVFIDAGE